MSKLTWDGTGERFYQSGVSKGVLYRQNENGKYTNGVAWNGLTGVSESPEGGEATDLWADNMKYATLRSAEDFKYTITAYHYPDEFEECDGSVEVEGLPGVRIRQQKRKPFGLCYRTEKNNDTDTGTDDGYILHLVYGSTCSPSDREYTTINDNPDAVEFSWDCETVPVTVSGYKPIAVMEIDSTKLTSAKLTALENKLYGTDTEGNNEGTSPELPLPDDIIDLLKKVS